MKKNVLRLLFSLILLASTSSCHTHEEVTLYFIGDSIIARWDIEESLPSFVTYNFGVSGAGISYIESLHGTQRGHKVVVMIGTNDLSGFTGETWAETYASRYVEAIFGMEAEHVYLFSILPRSFGDVSKYDIAIPEVNTRIKALVADNRTITYINVYDAFLSGNHIDYALYSDGLHLSQEGYEVLTNALRRAL